LHERDAQEAALARRYLAEGDFLRAAIFGQEAAISGQVLTLRKRPDDFDARNEARDWLNANERDFKTLSTLRNALAHGTRPASGRALRICARWGQRSSSTGSRHWTASSPCLDGELGKLTERAHDTSQAIRGSRTADLIQLPDRRKLAGSPFARRCRYLAPRSIADVSPVTARDPYLLAYDVADPRRLRAALKLARGHATGGQRSVHECFLTPSERRALLADYAALLDTAFDRLLLLRLDPRSRTYALGTATAPADPDFFYVG
jgi:CRISPR-associated protein Cas2